MSDPRVILHLLPTLALGGGQALVLHNIAAGDAARFRHIVCHVRPPDTMSPSFLARGVPTLCLGVRSAAGQAAAMARMFRLVARERVDIIHTNNTLPDLRFGLAAAAAFRIPAVNTLHTEEVIGAPGTFAARVRDRFLEWTARRALTRAIAVSPNARQAWLPRMQRMGLAPHDVLVVTPGVDLPEPADPEMRARVRSELGLRQDQPVLIHVGRLVPSKGQATLIEVLPSLLQRRPDLVLLLVGDGPEHDALKSAAAAASLNGAVRFLGSRTDVPHLLAAADLFAFPSRTEGFGLAPLEALASGVPVVAFDLPTLRRFVLPGKTGLLVPPDAPALAHAIEELLADPGARASFGAHGRALVAGAFDIRASAAAIENIYDDVLASHKPLNRRLHDRHLAHLN